MRADTGEIAQAVSGKNNKDMVGIQLDLPKAPGPPPGPPPPPGQASSLDGSSSASLVSPSGPAATLANEVASKLGDAQQKAQFEAMMRVLASTVSQSADEKSPVSVWQLLAEAGRQAVVAMEAGEEPTPQAITEKVQKSIADGSGPPGCFRPTHHAPLGPRTARPTHRSRRRQRPRASRPAFRHPVPPPSVLAPPVACRAACRPCSPLSLP